MKIGNIKIDFFANGKKHNWCFWRSLLYFFFASFDPLDGLHIKAEGFAFADMSGKVLSREFYTFRSFYAYCRYMPFYYFRKWELESIKNAEKLAVRLGLPKKLASQIGAIAFNATENAQVAGSVTSTTFSFTAGSGANRAILVTPGYSDANAATSTVTWAGISLTSGVSIFDSAANSGRSSIWYLVAPTTGVNNVVVSYSQATVAGNRGGVGVLDYTGVAQTGTIGITGTNSSAPGVTSLDITFTTQTANSWLICTTWWGGGGTLLAGQGETIRYQRNTGVETGTEDKATTTAGSYTTGWDATSANSVVMAALEMKEAAAVTFIPQVIIF